MKVGDKVEIVNYGALMWQSKKEYDKVPKDFYLETDYVYWIDHMPHLLGKQGVITQVIKTWNSTYKYSLSGVKGKSSWYNQEQLKFIDG